MNRWPDFAAARRVGRLCASVAPVSRFSLGGHGRKFTCAPQRDFVDRLIAAAHTFTPAEMAIAYDALCARLERLR